MIHKFNAGCAICGIYAIYIDNKIVYIGQSSNLNHRAQEHESSIRKGYVNNNYRWYNLAKEFYERGHEFKFEILEEIENDQLLSRETELIKKHWPIFNERIDTKEKKKVPATYEEAIELLGINAQPLVNMQQIRNEERAEAIGWFGECPPKPEKWYWWEFQ